MFIPKSEILKFEQSDNVVLIKELEVPSGIFTIGHKFKIKSGISSTFTLIDKNKNVAEDIDFTYFTHDIILNDKNKQQRLSECKDIIHTALQFSCTQKTTEWEEYTSYTACKLKNDDLVGYSNQCRTNIECVCHLPKKILKRKDIVTSLRKLKLENLLK